MRHQRLEVNYSSCRQSDRLGIDVVVAVLKLQINLIGRHVHEGDVLEVLPDADNEDCTSEAGCLNN